MRTTLDIDEALLREVVELSGARSKKQAIDAAMREYVRTRNLRRLIGMLGTLDIEDHREELREAERRRRERLDRAWAGDPHVWEDDPSG